MSASRASAVSHSAIATIMSGGGCPIPAQGRSSSRRASTGAAGTVRVGGLLGRHEHHAGADELHHRVEPQQDRQDVVGGVVLSFFFLSLSRQRRSHAEGPVTAWCSHSPPCGRRARRSALQRGAWRRASRRDLAMGEARRGRDQGGRCPSKSPLDRELREQSSTVRRARFSDAGGNGHRDLPAFG